MFIQIKRPFRNLSHMAYLLHFFDMAGYLSESAAVDRDVSCFITSAGKRTPAGRCLAHIFMHPLVNATPGHRYITYVVVIYLKKIGVDKIRQLFNLFWLG